LSDSRNILATAKPGDIVPVLRPLPGYSPRPDLALALKRALRDCRLRCVSVGEIPESAPDSATLPAVAAETGDSEASSNRASIKQEAAER
jgi:hypothetical protein